MSRRLDIGIASYKNPEKLRATLASIAKNSTTDWRCFVIHNPSDDVIAESLCRDIFDGLDGRFLVRHLPENVGYAGAVNALMKVAQTEYIAYCDNDIEILTAGWDEKLCLLLDRFHEIGMAFPNGGAYPIDRDNYTEILWQAGFCWVLNRLAMADTGQFDAELGHQEEADYCQRVRMAGWKCAADPRVMVHHAATATNNPDAIERINRGVVRWVDKWNRYFNGKNFNYHSSNVTRFEDWPPTALYLEEYWRMKAGNLNAGPETVRLDGREYDLIRVPRLAGFYRNRII